MTRKPKDNYYQDKGRPHLGLENPEKFGLTFNEVVDLIDTGRWPSFLKSWKRKQKKIRKVREKKYVCPDCFSYVEDLSKWSYDGARCSECVNKRKVIPELSPEDREKGKRSRRQRRRCHYCKKLTTECSTLLNRNICKSCARKILGPKDETKS